MGSKWSKISEELSDKNRNEIKNRFYSTLRRIANKKKEDGEIGNEILRGNDLLQFVDEALEYGHACNCKRGRKRKNPINRWNHEKDVVYIKKEENEKEYTSNFPHINNPHQIPISSKAPTLMENFILNGNPETELVYTNTQKKIAPSPNNELPILKSAFVPIIYQRGINSGYGK